MQIDKEKDEREIEEIEHFIDILFGSGPLTEEDRIEITEILHNEEYQSKITKAISDFLNKPRNRKKDLRKGQRMYEQILSKPGNTIPRFIPKRIPIYKRISFRIAAVLIPLFVLGTFVGLQVGSRDNTPPDTREYAQTPVDISPLIILEANDGDRLISLPDGSNIRLYEGSSLAYDATFSENRVVALQGDAFFTVAKANGKTFEVLYNDVTVRVLGTEFQLCGRDSTTEVTLCSGSVEVISSGYTVQLEPLQQFVSENNSREYTVIELSEEDIARFYKSRLQFRRTPLRTALEQTAQFFNVEIEIESLSYNEPVRLSFGITDNLEDVLYMLQLVTDNAFSYRIEEGKVTVQGR